MNKLGGERWMVGSPVNEDVGVFMDVIQSDCQSLPITARSVKKPSTPHPTVLSESHASHDRRIVGARRLGSLDESRTDVPWVCPCIQFIDLLATPPFLGWMVLGVSCEANRGDVPSIQLSTFKRSTRESHGPPMTQVPHCAPPLFLAML